ncbi:sulfatase-like hydrolase/transferase [Ramlibacter sp. AN1133]|uniref:sulfatase-like hydrolase/transferase n=1 Tax=Ramlibacter sp. AN1133 TaxID=3133429 RepID=UPI0030BE25EA
MTAAAGIGWRRPTGRELFVGAAVLALLAWLLAPRFGPLMASPLGLGFALALAGYLLRRNVWDAALLALPIAAGDGVELWLGPLLMTTTSASVFAATRRPRFAAAAGVVLLALLTIGIRFKERFAGAVLTWQDLRFFFLQFGDNVGVIASQPTLLVYCAAVLAGLAALGWFCWRLDRAAARASGPGGQIAAVLVALLLAGWGFHLLRGEIEALGRYDAWVLGGLGNYERPLSGFLATAARAPRWMPPSVDTATFRQQVQRQMAAAPGAAEPADIVLFLQESQFNPATIDGCPPALCRLDVFQPRGDTVSQGPLQVNVFGGGTWLSEFALASGVPHTTFGPAGDFAPFTVAPGMHRSFARSLKAAGYRTVAVYPVRGGMMNARRAYASYGFDRFLDSDDLGLSGSYHTSDHDVHAAARRVLEEERRHGQPVFLMVVTIFNHAEHGARMDRVPTALVDQAAGSFPQGKLAINVADYIWRTREFESALAATRTAVLDAGRPAVLAWFGDHQPPFGNALQLRDRIQSVPTPQGVVPARFQTWYQVSSNAGHLRRDAALRRLDVSFLPGLLAQVAGVRFDEWLAANVTAREECAGVLQGCVNAASRGAYLSYLRQDLGEFDGLP